MRTIDALAAEIGKCHQRTPPSRATLIALSGIDGSGKGYVTTLLAQVLREQGMPAVQLGVDGWLNLPQRRFNPARPAGHFYEHALRLDEMFDQLVEPLRRDRCVDVTVDHTEETATAYRPEKYRLENVLLILLEGIFLFKKEYRGRYDMAVWIDCSFQTALQRALRRRQEALSDEETIRAYETIYFPAQRLHMSIDRPREGADLVVPNDGPSE
jgi:uridine kinase